MLELIWQGIGVLVFALIAYGVWMGAFSRIEVQAQTSGPHLFIYRTLEHSDYPRIRALSETVEAWLEAHGVNQRLPMQAFSYAGKPHQVGYCVSPKQTLPPLPKGFQRRELPAAPALGARFSWRAAPSYAVAMTRVPPILARAQGQPAGPNQELHVQMHGDHLLILLLPV